MVYSASLRSIAKQNISFLKALHICSAGVCRGPLCVPQVWPIDCHVISRCFFRTLTMWPLAVAVDGSKYLVIRSLFMPGIDISSSGWFLVHLVLTT